MDPLKYRWQTDFNFQGICQAIRHIQINHHTYYFELETVHIISKRSNGQVSNLHRHWPVYSLSAHLGFTFLKNTSNESFCVWLMINHDLVNSAGIFTLVPLASCVQKKGVFFYICSQTPAVNGWSLRTKVLSKMIFDTLILIPLPNVNLTTNRDLTLLKEREHIESFLPLIRIKP